MKKIKPKKLKVRGDWGKIKPYTRIEENKKRKEELTPKYKKDLKELSDLDNNK